MLERQLRGALALGRVGEGDLVGDKADVPARVALPADREHLAGNQRVVGDTEHVDGLPELSDVFDIITAGAELRVHSDAGILLLEGGDLLGEGVGERAGAKDDQRLAGGRRARAGAALPVELELEPQAATPRTISGSTRSTSNGGSHLRALFVLSSGCKCSSLLVVREPPEQEGRLTGTPAMPAKDRPSARGECVTPLRRRNGAMTAPSPFRTGRHGAFALYPAGPGSIGILTLRNPGLGDGGILCAWSCRSNQQGRRDDQAPMLVWTRGRRIGVRQAGKVPSPEAARARRELPISGPARVLPASTSVRDLFTPSFCCTWRLAPTHCRREDRRPWPTMTCSPSALDWAASIAVGRALAP